MMDELVLSRLDEELLKVLEEGDWFSRSEITKMMGKAKWYVSWEMAFMRLEKAGLVESRQTMSRAKSGQMLWQYRLKQN